MAEFELVLALLLGGVGLALIAPRLGVPWPALLALAGAGLAFLPGIPEVILDPDLALALFVAPVLLDAAYDASPRDLRDNWFPVSGLVVGAVGCTVIAVAGLACWLDPSLPWGAGVALGAIVAPPDAAAAAAVLRQFRLPHRVVVILEGESLLNDATALLVYRFAVVALASGVTLWTIPWLIATAAGGVVLGVALARLYIVATAQMRHGVETVLLQFLGTFGVWLLAQSLGMSAILTMVAYALTLARLAPSQMGARDRRASYAVWDVAVFALNVLAFVLMGFQLRGILGRLGPNAGQYATFAGAVLVTVVLARVTWVMSYYTVLRWKEDLIGARAQRALVSTSVQGGMIVAWCGLRGIVTLSAALALPEWFPKRDLIVFTSFCVVLGTLVGQGMSLRPLLNLLNLPRDDSVAREVALARQEGAQAALDALEAEPGSKLFEEMKSFLRLQYRARLDTVIALQGMHGDPTGLKKLRRLTLAAERTRLMVLRREELIGDDAFHQVEEELDWSEADVDQPK